MSNTLSQRIRDEMERNGLSMRELARRIGITQPSISKWCNGVAEPKLEHLQAMAKLFGVSAEWLTYGNGNDHSNSCRDEVVIRHSGKIQPNCDFSLKLTPEACDRLFEAKPENLSLYLVTQSDMAPNVKPSDTLLIDTSINKAVYSGLYLIDVNGTHMVRRIYPMLNGKFTITCDNANFPPGETIEAKDLTVIGKVISSLTFAVKD